MNLSSPPKNSRFPVGRIMAGWVAVLLCSLLLYDALQRVGQVIGPVCVGAVMAIMSVDDAARWAGLALTGISLLFLLLVRPARRTGGRA